MFEAGMTPNIAIAEHDHLETTKTMVSIGSFERAAADHVFDDLVVRLPPQDTSQPPARLPSRTERPCRTPRAPRGACSMNRHLQRHRRPRGDRSNATGKFLLPSAGRALDL